MTSIFAHLSWRNRQALRLTLAVWALGLAQFFTVLAVWGRGTPPSWSYLFLLAAVLTGLFWSGLLYAVHRLLDTRPNQIRWIAMGVLVPILALVQSFTDHLAYRLAQGMAPGPFDQNYLEGIIVNIQIYTWLYGLYAVALELLKRMEGEQVRALQLAEAREAAQEAKLEALRFQLNPHFLFNTLNAISSLVIKQRNAEAEIMTGKLARFLRMTFHTDPKQPIPLADELATIEAYLDIETVRFGDRLHVKLDCPAPLMEAQVPSFILQPLVENAVKYAVAPARLGAMVRVVAQREGEELVLTVADTGPGGGQRPTSGTGVGLQNIRSRLSTLYGAAGRLETHATETGFTAQVRMPLTFETLIPKVA